MFSKLEFIEANKTKKTNTLDYLHALYKFESIHIDLLKSMSELFNPPFIVRDNNIFLKEVFDENKYAELITRQYSNSEISYWINLIEITSIFEGIDSQDAITFGKDIVNVWNNKIRHEYPTKNVKAKLIYDQDTEEVYITISS